MKIRISDHKLMIETGRYNQTSHNDRFCPICNSGIIEDEFHFLFHCPKYSIPREKFYNQIQQNFVDFNQLSYTELIIKLMNSQNFSINSHLLKLSHHVMIYVVLICYQIMLMTLDHLIIVINCNIVLQYCNYTIIAKLSRARSRGP